MSDVCTGLTFEPACFDLPEWRSFIPDCKIPGLRHEARSPERGQGEHPGTKCWREWWNGKLILNPSYWSFQRPVCSRCGEEWCETGPGWVYASVWSLTKSCWTGGQPAALCADKHWKQWRRWLQRVQGCRDEGHFHYEAGSCLPPFIPWNAPKWGGSTGAAGWLTYGHTHLRFPASMSTRKFSHLPWVRDEGSSIFPSFLVSHFTCCLQDLFRSHLLCLSWYQMPCILFRSGLGDVTCKAPVGSLPRLSLGAHSPVTLRGGGGRLEGLTLLLLHSGEHRAPLAGATVSEAAVHTTTTLLFIVGSVEEVIHPHLEVTVTGISSNQKHVGPGWQFKPRRLKTLGILPAHLPPQGSL